MPTALRRVMAVLTLVVATLATLAPSPANASSSYLCHGYTSCANQGYPNAGYQLAAKNSYWLMTKGHNCTNYVAFRLVSKGLPNKRPWTGTGNAYNWGAANPGRTDLTQAVGAVAWWKKNVKGAGSNGHVAYVEQVISADEIIVSEDNWGGDFDWRRIKRASGWPSGFLHFADPGVGSPRGRLDASSIAGGARLSLRGWAFDPDRAASAVQIRAYVGGPPGVGTSYKLNSAKLSRPDVAKAYPKAGAKHGFEQTITVKPSTTAQQAGKVVVYVYAVNVTSTPGVWALLGRKTVTMG